MAPLLDYDVVVVGAGMFGSSAAKHVRVLRPALRVAVVGPSTNGGSLARGQHFDEARICRRVETCEAWAHLNNLGALSYGATEAACGVAFYTACGCVWVGTGADSAACVRCLGAVARGGDATFAVVGEDGVALAGCANGATSVVRVTSSSVVAEGVYGGEVRVGQLGDGIAGAEGGTAVYVAESGRGGGGTVHPTRYVAAQLACAAAVSPAAQFTHVEEVVVRIACVGGEAGTEGGAAVYEVTTDAGHTYRAGRVLVATASFAKYHQLLPDRITDLLHPHPAYVVLVRVTPPHGDNHDANTQASETFPSVICTAGLSSGHFYALPPRYYADRRGWFIKMGRASDWLSANKDADVQTLDGALRWYDEGAAIPVSHPAVLELRDRLTGLYPAWPAVPDGPNGEANAEVVRCIFDETDDELPVIGAADGKGLFCAIGGCGRGAKACDPIGCIAAHRLLGVELPQSYHAVKDLFHPMV